MADERARAIVADNGTPLDDKAPSAGWLSDLFRSEHARLARMLGPRVRDRDAIADLLQDAFVRLSSASTTQKPDRPAAYLQRIVRNLVVDRARRSHHERALVPLDDCTLPSLAPEQEQAITAHDLMRRYRDALATLTPHTRRVFLMHRVDELTYREIARRLGISVATVEYHMSRALVHLDEALSE